MKQKIKLTPMEKKAQQKERERRFNRIAIAVTLLIALACLLALGFAVIRNIDFKRGTPYEKEDLQNHYWYTEDGTACWFFTEETGSSYVYFFTRESEDDPYITKVYTAFTVDGEKGKVDVYLEKGVPTTFTCVFKDDSLTLSSSEQTLHFKKDIAVAEKNKLILGVVGSPYDKSELIGSWYSSEGNHCWQFLEDGTVRIFRRESTEESFDLKETPVYTPGGEEGKLSVDHTEGGPMVYTCTIRDNKLILVYSTARLILYKGEEIMP